MAAVNANNAYLSFDGVDISAYWTEELSYDPSVESVDITAGAGRTGVQRAAGLLDNNMSFMVIYDDTDLATYVGKLEPGTVATLIYGPESNVAGKPKFEGSMILQSVSLNQGVPKPKMAFNLTFEQADEPTSRIENGDTF